MQTELTQAYESNDAEAEQEISVNFAESIKGLVENGIISGNQIITDTQKIESKKNTLQYLGKLDSIFSDLNLDLRTREQEFNKLEESFDADTATFSKEDKEKARKDLKSYKKNAIEKDKSNYQQAEITLEADQLDKLANLRTLIRDPQKSFDEKEYEIRLARFQGLSDENETVLMNLLNSSKKLNAVDDEDFKDEILQLTNDLIQSTDSDPVNFLRGLSSLERRVLKESADGKLEQGSEQTIMNQIQQLTRGKLATETKFYSTKFGALTDLMNEYYPQQPELKNTIIREFFFEIQPLIDQENVERLEKGEDPLDPIELNEKLTEFFKKRTQQIQTQSKNDALNLINSTSINLLMMS